MIGWSLVSSRLFSEQGACRWVADLAVPFAPFLAQRLVDEVLEVPVHAIAGFDAHRDRERKGPVSSGTGPTPNRGCIQGHPTGLGHLPEEVVAHRLENGKKLARLQPALSMLADTIVPVDRRPLARVERDRPATAGRRCRASRGAAQRKGAEMRDSGKGPRGGPIIWLMAVIAVCLAPAVHPIAADVILTALAVWAMRNGR